MMLKYIVKFISPFFPGFPIAYWHVKMHVLYTDNTIISVHAYEHLHYAVIITTIQMVKKKKPFLLLPKISIMISKTEQKLVSLTFSKISSCEKVSKLTLCPLWIFILKGCIMGNQKFINQNYSDIELTTDIENAWRKYCKKSLTNYIVVHQTMKIQGLVYLKNTVKIWGFACWFLM